MCDSLCWCQSASSSCWSPLCLNFASFAGQWEMWARSYRFNSVAHHKKVLLETGSVLEKQILKDFHWLVILSKNINKNKQKTPKENFCWKFLDVNSNLKSKTLILKDSSVMSILTYLTVSPCYTTETNKHDSTTNSEDHAVLKSSKNLMLSFLIFPPHFICITGCIWVNQKRTRFVQFYTCPFMTTSEWFVCWVNMTVSLQLSPLC